jgi:hypothetical protein
MWLGPRSHKLIRIACEGDMLPPRDPNDDDDESEEDERDEDEEEPAVIREPDE